METVNERTTSIITVAFFDEDEAAVTPSAASYKIDDIGSSTAILASTAIGALDTTVDLTITAAQNAILSETNLYESRKVTVTWTYGGGKQGTNEYIYRIKNLSGVTT